jgi:hypothetical protein
MYKPGLRFAYLEARQAPLVVSLSNHRRAPFDKLRVSVISMVFFWACLF